MLTYLVLAVLPCMAAGSATSSLAELLISPVVPQFGAPKIWNVFFHAFSVVGVAELFDKTWFVALLYSTRCGAQMSFWASFFALALHTIIAAGLGATVSKAVPLYLLHFITAGVFGVLALAYLYEYCYADPNADALETRTEDARESVRMVGDEEGQREGRPLLDKVVSKGQFRQSLYYDVMQFWQVFLAVFVAEWGDRTQIAMLSLHSSLPLVPVVLGSLAAFFLLSLSAVLVATMLKGKRLSERLICGVSAFSFMCFSLLALNSGFQTMLHPHPERLT